MGKRFAILIAEAALGAAVMAAGASANFRSVDDPRGDTRCHHEREANHRPCSDSMRRNADIVRATAGHGGTRLRHTIRVVGKVQSARLAINTDSDRFRDWIVRGIERGRGRSGEVLDTEQPRHRTGRARYDFHHHSVEISFSEGSIGNPRHYGWSVYASAGRSAGHSVDYVPNLRGRHYIRYIGHRLAQPAAKAPDVVKYDTRVTIARDRTRLYHGLVKSEVRKCERGRRVVLFKRRPGADRKVGADRSNRQGTWGVPGGPPGGRVYAKAKRKVRPNGSVCRKDRSRTFIQPHHPVRQSPGLL